MSLDPDTLRQIRLQLEALLALIRDAEGKESSGAFKKDGLSYDQLRALARSPRKQEAR